MQEIPRGRLEIEIRALHSGLRSRISCASARRPSLSDLPWSEVCTLSGHLSGVIVQSFARERGCRLTMDEIYGHPLVVKPPGQIPGSTLLTSQTRREEHWSKYCLALDLLRIAFEVTPASFARAIRRANGFESAPITFLS